MKCEIIRVKGDWNEVLNAARTTSGKNEVSTIPNDKWKKNILIAEHSPIRKIIINWKWIDLPYWVSVHFIRHKFGIEHWVKSQRTDRTGIDRSTLLQSENVMHECEANLQSIIYVSRKRLCTCASPETKKAWELLIESIETIDPIIKSICVPECIYRGFCPEMKSCGYYKTIEFSNNLTKYRGYDNYEKI